MNGDSRGHLTSSSQAAFRRYFLIAIVVLVVVLAPLVVLGDRRLDIAHRFGWVPDAGVEQIAGSDQDIDLLVIPIQVQLRSPRPQIRYHAAIISRPGNGGRELQSIDSGVTVTLPIPRYDLVSAAPDGGRVLFREGSPVQPGRVFVLDIRNFSLAELPAGQRAPDDSDHWDIPITQEIANECDGISPGASFITCFGDPKLATFLAGDYELDVIRYGNPKAQLDVYRGLGFRPIVGWSLDDRWLYFQNERGIWRVNIRDDMFPSSQRAYGNL